MTENTKITFDEEGVYQQQKEEILNTKHSLYFEVIVPPVEVPEEKDFNSEGVAISSCSPLASIKSNESTSTMTHAVLIKTLIDYVIKSLADRDVLAAYSYLSSNSITGDFKDLGEILKGGKNDTNINS